MSENNDLIAWLRSDAERLASSIAGNDPAVRSHVETLRRWAEMLASRPAPKATPENAEPVAWRYLTPTGWHATTKIDRALGASTHRDMQPLYATPQPPKEAHEPIYQVHFSHGWMDVDPMDYGGLFGEKRIVYAAPQPTQATGEPVAYVPVHPRTGPLWANTVPSLDSDRPAHYPVRALCYAAPQPASEPVNAPSLESRADFALKALVAAGHVTQDKVDRALTIAEKFNSHQPASEQQDHFDTLIAVLNAIGYTEEFAAQHPDLKVSEGVKLFLALQNGTIECQAHIGPDCTECGGTGVWTGEQHSEDGLSDEHIERASRAWFDTPGTYYERMRAAFRAAKGDGHAD